MKLGIILPHLNIGGIERGMVRLLAPLHDAQIEVTLFLQSKTGALLDELPETVAVVDLGKGGVLKSARALGQILKAEPVDVLWSATNAANVLNLLTGVLLGKAAPKSVIGEHIPLMAFIETRKFPALRKAVMRLLYPRAAAVTAPLEPILQEHETLLRRRCPRCVALPNPVLDGLAKDRELAPQALNFVTLGRLSSEKGYDLAIQTFASLASDLPDARLTLFGDGPAREELEKIARDLSVANRVTFAGAVPHAHIALDTADMLWCTSQVEGFGNVLVEAQGAGVPVASVDCPFGPRHILDGGKAGCLMTGRNPADLAQDIVAFAQDLSQRRAAQDAGYRRAAMYTRAASAKAHVAFFRSL